MDKYDIAAIAEMDRLDTVLGDLADDISKVTAKDPELWDEKDWTLVEFSLHASAARGCYIKLGRIENGEKDD